MRHRRFLVVVLAAGLSATGFVRADESLASHPVVGHAAIGYAAPMGDAGDFFHGGWQAAGGVTFHFSPKVPVGLRLDLGHARFPAVEQTLGDPPSTVTQVHGGRLLMTHLMADALWEFGGPGHVGGWLGAGVGAVNRRIEATGTTQAGSSCDDIFPICVAVPGESFETDDRLTKLGYDLTAALRFPLQSGSEVFLEVRYQRMESNPATEFLPVLIGFLVS